MRTPTQNLGLDIASEAGSHGPLGPIRRVEGGPSFRGGVVPLHHHAQAATVSGMADLVLLRTLVAVVRTGSITHAARQLRLTQPAVSAHVKSLEVQVGQPLFVRTARGMKPTPQAERLAEQITLHVEALEAIALGLRPEGGPGPSTVYVGGPPDYLAALVLPSLAPLVQDGLSIVGVPGLLNDLMDRLGAGDLDVVVATARTARSEIHYEPAGEVRYVLVASPAWASRLGGALAEGTADVASMPFLAFTREAPLVDAALRAWGASTPVRVVLTVPDQRAMISAAEAGAGVALVPDFLARAALTAGTLREVPGPTPPAPEEIWIATRAGRRRAPDIERCVRAILSGFAATEGM